MKNSKERLEKKIAYHQKKYGEKPQTKDFLAGYNYGVVLTRHQLFFPKDPTPTQQLCHIVELCEELKPVLIDADLRLTIGDSVTVSVDSKKSVKAVGSPIISTELDKLIDKLQKTLDAGGF